MEILSLVHPSETHCSVEIARLPTQQLSDSRQVRNGNVSPQGLTRVEVELRLRQYGPKAVREAKPYLSLAIAQKFWAPVPWMLEATIILELILGKRPEALIIGFLLVFNAGLGFVRENRAPSPKTASQSPVCSHKRPT